MYIRNNDMFNIVLCICLNKNPEKPMILKIYYEIKLFEKLQFKKRNYLVFSIYGGIKDSVQLYDQRK